MLGLRGRRSARYIAIISRKLLFQRSGVTLSQQRERSILVSWLLGILSVIPDIVVTIMTQSVTMLTDVFRTGTDTMASFLSWLTVRKISRGHTAKYNYGYGKLENLASLAVAGAMILSFFVIVFSAVERLHTPRNIHNIFMGIVFTVFAGAANSLCWYRNKRLARHAPSPVMESQWRLFRAKTMINLCVLTSLVLSAIFHEHAWSRFIDPLGSMLLASFLLFSSYQLVSMSVYDLLDRSLDESLRVGIDGVLETFAGRYTALCGIRSRRSGSHVYIEIALCFPAAATMGEVQLVVSELQASLVRKIPASQITIVPSTEAPAAIAVPVTTAAPRFKISLGSGRK